MLAAIAVLALALVVVAVGTRLITTGRLVMGAKGHPTWNLLQIYRREPVKVRPWVARLLGMLYLALGVFALSRVAHELLAGL